MWEISICFDNEIESNKFLKSIVSYIKGKNGVVVSILCDNYYKILIALPLEYKLEAYRYINIKLAEIILTIYKKQYIFSRLNFETDFSTNMQIFLQALVCFDTEIDKDIIINSISYERTFFVSAFFNFRLKHLKQKWNELIDLANDNVMYLLNEDNFFELIKFLISNLEHRYYAVNIFSRNNCYLLCDLEGKKVNDYLLDKYVIYDDNKLLASLVALNPEKIILHCNNLFKDKLIKKLYNLFNNRIEICQ